MKGDAPATLRVLRLLREWGWDAAVERLDADIRATADPTERAELELIVAWHKGERGAAAEADAHLAEVERHEEFRPWVLVARATMALRVPDHDLAHRLLDSASTSADPADASLAASIAHCRGAVLFHQGARLEAALAELERAFELLSPGQFLVGRILDTMGMVHQCLGDFHAAYLLFERAIEVKSRFDDRAGVALSLGNLGRLHLSWGNLALAEEKFRADLEIARSAGDRRGEAQMHDHLGQVELERGRGPEALECLDVAVDRSNRGGWRTLEGFARKDRAFARLLSGDVAGAEADALAARELLLFPEGRAHADRALGLVRRAQQRGDESEALLRSSCRWFADHGEPSEAARSELEVARTLAAQGAPKSAVVDALESALGRAESCRRDALVGTVEEELRRTDPLRYAAYAYRRVRGRGIDASTSSLFAGTRETVTVTFLDLRGSTDFVRMHDPEVVMATFNELMSRFGTVLRAHGMGANQYLGDGFMAIARGRDHARRSVDAALELVRATAEFNRPRRLLGLRPFEARIGVCTGEAVLGNVGTYDKMDFTAIGRVVNTAARIQAEAVLDLPCIAQSTQEQVAEQFAFADGNPRTVAPKGLAPQPVWDVVGRRDAAGRSPHA